MGRRRRRRKIIILITGLYLVKDMNVINYLKLVCWSEFYYSFAMISQVITSNVVITQAENKVTGSADYLCEHVPCSLSQLQLIPNKAYHLSGIIRLKNRYDLKSNPLN